MGCSYVFNLILLSSVQSARFRYEFKMKVLIQRETNL